MAEGHLRLHLQNESTTLKAQDEATKTKADIERNAKDDINDDEPKSPTLDSKFEEFENKVKQRFEAGSTYANSMTSSSSASSVYSNDTITEATQQSEKGRTYVSSASYSGGSRSLKAEEPFVWTGTKGRKYDTMAKFIMTELREECSSDDASGSDTDSEFGERVKSWWQDRGSDQKNDGESSSERDDGSAEKTDSAASSERIEEDMKSWWQNRKTNSGSSSERDEEQILQYRKEALRRLNGRTPSP